MVTELFVKTQLQGEKSMFLLKIRFSPQKSNSTKYLSFD